MVYEGFGFSGKSRLTLEKKQTERFLENKSSVSFAKIWKEPPPLDEWLKTYRSEKEQAEYALMILKKYFDRNGLEFRKPEPVLNFRGFGSNLFRNIGELVKQGEHSTMLKNLLAELTDFFEAVSGECLAFNLFNIFYYFLDRGAGRSLFVRLLPAKALVKFDEIDEIWREEWEAYLELADLMDY